MRIGEKLEKKLGELHSIGIGGKKKRGFLRENEKNAGVFKKFEVIRLFGRLFGPAFQFVPATAVFILSAAVKFEYKYIITIHVPFCISSLKNKG